MNASVIGPNKQSSGISTYGYDVRRTPLTNKGQRHQFGTSDAVDVHVAAVKDDCKGKRRTNGSKKSLLVRAVDYDNEAGGSWVNTAGCGGPRWKGREAVYKVIAELAQRIANKDGEIETLRERAAEQDKIIRELRSISPSFLQLRYCFMKFVKQLLSQNLSEEARSVLRKQLAVFRSQEEEEGFRKVFAKELLKWSYYKVFPPGASVEEDSKSASGTPVKSQSVVRKVNQPNELLKADAKNSQFVDLSKTILWNSNSQFSSPQCSDRTNEVVNNSLGNFYPQHCVDRSDFLAKIGSFRDQSLIRELHINKTFPVVDATSPAEAGVGIVPERKYPSIFDQDIPTTSSIGENYVPKSKVNGPEFKWISDTGNVFHPTCREKILHLKEQMMPLAANCFKRSLENDGSPPAKYSKEVDDDVIVLSSDDGS